MINSISPKIIKVKRIFNSSWCNNCGRIFKHDLKEVQTFCNEKCGKRFVEREEQYKKEEEGRIRRYGEESPPLKSKFGF